MTQHLTDRAVSGAADKNLRRQKEDCADYKAGGWSNYSNLEFGRGLRGLTVQGSKAAEHIQCYVAGSQTFGAGHRRVCEFVNQDRYKQQHSRDKTERPILNARESRCFAGQKTGCDCPRIKRKYREPTVVSKNWNTKDAAEIEWLWIEIQPHWLIDSIALSIER